MPRKRQFRRLRRLRLIGTAGAFAALFGGAAGVSATGDALHHRQGGVAGMAIGGVLVAAGIVAATWALRRHDRVEANEREWLKASGLDDGLPMGVSDDIATRGNSHEWDAEAPWHELAHLIGALRAVERRVRHATVPSMAAQ